MAFFICELKSLLGLYGFILGSIREFYVFLAGKRFDLFTSLEGSIAIKRGEFFANTRS